MFTIHLSKKEDVEDLLKLASRKREDWERDIKFCGKGWWAGSEESRLSSLAYHQSELKRWKHIEKRCQVALCELPATH